VSDVECLFCGAPLRDTFVDLGMSPLCESFLRADQLNQGETFYPLDVRLCRECLLVQLQVYVDPKDIFTEYAYFSSYSTAWLEHAKAYVDMIVARQQLDGRSLVVELASNDGYLLQYFKPHGVPVLGIEPAANVARAAAEKGVPTLVRFFGTELARELAGQGTKADLILGNNVLAQVPDVNSFVGGMKVLLREGGLVTIEFPHLLRLIEGNQFDTIYHEHFFYFSLVAAERIFARHGLAIFDVEELWTHGGSLRIFAAHAEEDRAPSAQLLALRERERAAGFHSAEGYAGFEERVRATKRDLVAFLIEARRSGKAVAAYGAPGKGNTLLNYCGIRTDLVDYAVDRNPYKHGRFLPGTHIPVHPSERLAETKPDYILILPWNLKDEIVKQLAYTREWGAKLVVPIPRLEVIG
jgi:C-methyltransferase-like protein/putative zinc binding protein/methyltransferase family protein